MLVNGNTINDSEDTSRRVLGMTNNSTQKTPMYYFRFERIMDERNCINFYRVIPANETDNNTSSSTANYSVKDTGTAAQLCGINLMLWDLIPPIYLIIGTFGNIFSIVIWSNRRLAHQTQHMTIVLMCLGFADTLVLYTGFLRHYLRKSTYIGWNIQNAGMMVCKIHEFLVYFGLSFSVWLVAFIAVERCFCIVFSHPKVRNQLPKILCCFGGNEARAHDHKRGLCCRRPVSIYIMVVLIACISIFVNSHIFWTRVFHTHDCANDRITFKVFLETVWPAVDLAFSAIVPVSLVIASTILIAFTLCCLKSNTLSSVNNVAQTVRKAKATKRSVKSDGSQEHSSVRSDRSKRRSVVERKTNRITCTLICVSLCYVVCTCPAKVYIVFVPTITPRDVTPEIFFRYRLLWTCLLSLQYLANVVNFLIYSVANSLFRDQLREIFRSKRNSTRDPPPRSTRHSTSSARSGHRDVT
jgi:hypothetical protein